MEYQKAIRRIIRFKEKFDNIDIEYNEKIPEKLKGILGELYVAYKLQKKGFSGIERQRPYSPFDIYLKQFDKKIEVRSSFLKNEGIYPKPIQYYGWTVLRAKEKHPKYDILICVTLDKSLKNPAFYVFDNNDVEKIGEVKLWMKGVKKKIHLFNDEESYQNAKSTEPKLITEYEKYINENPDKFLDRWDKIKS